MLPKILGDEEAKLVIKNKKGKSCPYFFANTPRAKQLSGLTQIMDDLNHAQELIELIPSIENGEIAYSLWMSAVITYGKCFASAKGRRIKLENKHVVKAVPEALNFHKQLIDLRNEFFAHAGVNDYESSNVGIILAPEEDGKEVLWINHINVKKRTVSSEFIIPFSQLCMLLYDVVEKIGEKAHESVLAEYKAMDVNELYKNAAK